MDGWPGAQVLRAGWWRWRWRWRECVVRRTDCAPPSGVTVMVGPTGWGRGGRKGWARAQRERVRVEVRRRRPVRAVAWSVGTIPGPRYTSSSYEFNLRYRVLCHYRGPACSACSVTRRPALRRAPPPVCPRRRRRGTKNTKASTRSPPPAPPPSPPSPCRIATRTRSRRGARRPCPRAPRRRARGRGPSP